jgi:tripartite ATP-independent transporter DctM subunit
LTIALIGFASLILLCFFGFKVGFATMFVGVVGFAMERGWEPALAMTGTQIMEDAMNYNLSVIPLFILMGVFIYRADISRDLYDAAYVAVGQLRGGLALSTVIACAGFSAVCGSSIATAATMTKVAMPPMRKYRYADSLATGTIAAGGTLGIMIPPSVPLVIYGIVSEQDIALLFIAGIVPGLLLVSLFMIAVSVTVWFYPDAGPAGDPLPADQKRQALKAVWPVISLFVLVLGGIYGGIFTPTEAAGIGAFGAATIAWFRGHLRTVREWKISLVEAAKTTATLFIAIFGALVFAQFINLSGMPYDILDAIDEMNLTPWQLVLVIALIAVLMGMIFESIGILLLLVPVFLPALYESGVDMIWFGIVVVLVTELGLITPPIGMNVFVVKSVMPDAELRQIFKGVVPFIFAMVAGLVLVFAMPELATFLPNLMR